MRNILLTIVAAGLVGCVGGIDMPTTPPDQGVGGGGSGSAATAARTAFETNVYPIVAAKCIACHSSAGPSGNVTGFVAPAAADAYVTAVGYQALVGDWTPTGAPILLKIAAGHNAQTYSTDDVQKITDWLNLELASRTAGGTGTGSNPTGESPADATVRLTQQWSGCMQLTNFATANMKAWGTMRADNSECQTCHAGGAYGQIALATDGPFFGLISTNKYYMAQYFSVDLSGGVPTAKVIINTRSFAAVGGDLAPHTTHPRFTPTGSAGMVALQKFYDLTVAAMAIPAGMPGACGPSTLTN